MAAPAWASEGSGELAEQLLEGLSVQSLVELLAREDADFGGPTAAGTATPTWPSTETATGPRAATATPTWSTAEGPVRPIGLPEQLEEDTAEEDLAEDEEAPLDRILAQRTATWPEEEERDETGHELPRLLDLDAETTVVVLRQPDEFVCSACFLVKRRELLVDPERQLCRDCAA